MKCSHRTLLSISGLVWLAAGLNLLPLGLRLLTSTLDPASTASTPLINWMEHFLPGPEQAVLLFIIVGLAVGMMKSRFVLSKAVKREATRIKALSNPTHLTHLYSKKAVIVLAVMVLLGVSMKWLQLPPDIRGTLDVAIGAALINGALQFFRQAVNDGKETRAESQMRDKAAQQESSVQVDG